MTNILVPELGESVVEARVARWLKKEGERVEVGDPVVELETEKIDLEVNADRGGVITSIKHKEGDDVKIGEVLAVMDETASAPAAKPPGNGSERGPEPQLPAQDTRATPTARNVAKNHDVNLASIQGSGAAGRVMKQDVQKAIEPQVTKAPSPALSAPPARPAAIAAERREERHRMSKRRATIARRLVEAQHNAAMLTTFNEVDMTAVMALRERYQERFVKAHGIKLGFMSFFVKAAIEALKAFPAVNGEVRGTDIIYKDHYDIGVAVGGGKGLVVPVVRDADRLSFAEVEAAIADLAARARDNKLSMKELEGGTFTISNGGIYGSLLSTPILNPPQSGILGLHATQKRAVVVGDAVVVRPMMYVALSYDHRLIDGREAVQFLVRVKECVEDPDRILIEV